MPYKKLAILVCAAMLASALCGCSDGPVAAPDGAPQEHGAQGGEAPDGASQAGEAQAPPDTAPDSGDTAETHDIDFDAAFAAFPPDAAMIVEGDYTVTWAELFFLLREQLKPLLEGAASFPDFSQAQEDGMPLSRSVKDKAAGNALKFRALEHGAKLLGFEIKEDQRSFLGYMKENMLDSVGDEGLFAEMLWESNGVKDLGLFDYLLYLNYLPFFLFLEIYGESAENLSDEEAALLTDGEGYAVAKHIMRKKDGTGDATPMRELEIVLRQLRNYDGDDFGAFFDELMYGHSEDEGGLFDFPDGYLFRPGDMEPAFDEACRALEIGEISGIVETGEGYHILYRLPVNYDIVPIVYYRLDETDSLRVLAAMGLFEATLLGWKGDLSPTFTSDFESLDVSAIFVEK